MKKIIGCLCLVFALNLSAQETDAWTNYMNPSQAHKLLKTYEGTFRMEMTMWQEKDSILVPTYLVATSENKMILGDRFLQMNQKGPKLMGNEYTATTTIGFNNASQTMEVTSRTSFGTGTLHLSGDFDILKKEGDLRGIMSNVVDSSTVAIRQHIKFLDKDSFIIESYDRVVPKEDEEPLKEEKISVEAYSEEPETKSVVYRFQRIKS